MSVKLLGLLLVSGSIAMYGFVLSENYVKRVKQLSNLKRGLEMMTEDILYKKTPISVIAERLSGTTEFPANYLFSEIHERMRKSNAEVGEIINNLAISGDFSTLFNKSDILNLQAFGRGMTSTREEDVVNTLKYYISQLASDIDEANRKKSEKLKIYRSMGVVLGLFFLIINL